MISHLDFGKYISASLIVSYSFAPIRIYLGNFNWFAFALNSIMLRLSSLKNKRKSKGWKNKLLFVDQFLTFIYNFNSSLTVNFRLIIFSLTNEFKKLYL